jgi:hypothetical protein
MTDEDLLTVEGMIRELVADNRRLTVENARLRRLNVGYINQIAAMRTLDGEAPPEYVVRDEHAMAADYPTEQVEL